MAWSTNIASYFRNREEIGVLELCQQFGVSCKQDLDNMRECLSVFADEYDIRIGLLRPDDPLSLFTELPPTRNPLSWLFDRAAIEDKASELSFRLKQQRKRLGVAVFPPNPPVTLREYVACWLGKT